MYPQWQWLSEGNSAGSFAAADDIGIFGHDGRVERNGVPDWKLDEKFKDDVFTFVRIRYRSAGRWAWDTDYPDADLRTFPIACSN